MLKKERGAEFARKVLFNTREHYWKGIKAERINQKKESEENIPFGEISMVENFSF
jgi:hypothetical protein